jgi:hypothetical protein
MPIRPPVAVLVLAAGLTCGLVVVALVTGEPSAAGRSERAESVRTVAVPEVTGRSAALAVIHEWDVRRSRAWAHGDAGALSRLYVRGSSAGSADVALLQRYQARGFVVSAMRMQVFAVRVLTVRPTVLRLEVTDRLASAVAVRGEVRRPLPAGAASRRMLVLRKVRGCWLMARVGSARH